MSDIQRSAVITGATSDRGIGITVARRYAREGWAVVILDLDGEKSAKVAADIGNEFAVPTFGYAIDVAICHRSARWPTSPVSRRQCPSWRPRWSCGTW
jgi:NAD(P)-dependent dehydrogenase (short-subunit alcohol dehydrogenase family)